MPPAVLGLDVGGANLKAAHSLGAAATFSFELWKQPEKLTARLVEVASVMPPFGAVALTMTGELCDCFETKTAGVRHILAAVQSAAGDSPIRVLRNDGQMVKPAEARREPSAVASANWLALAGYAGRFVPKGCGMLVDVGSTTTDIIPIAHGRVVPRGRTDPERLAIRELVYSGVRRTPVCALLGAEGAAELFATIQDVYLVLGQLAEEPENHATADGRPATVACASARLARMVCADPAEFTPDQATALARRIGDRQRAALEPALAEVASRLPGPVNTVVISGSGEFLARDIITRVPRLATAAVISLAEKLGPARSEAACAYALAVLAAERAES
jgi:probable H4MPT-linked C1 transfer pathway protein